MEPNDLLPRVTDKEDIGLGLIGYVVGYCIDAWFFPGGLSSGVVAALSAAGIVGTKGMLSRLFDTWRRDDDSLSDDELRERSHKLHTYIEDFLRLASTQKDEALRVLQRELAAHEFLFRNGIISNREYNRFLNKASADCRDTIQLYLGRRLES